MKVPIVPMLLFFTLVCSRMTAQVADFTAPDTVCTGQPFHIQNRSTGGSNYYWSFCSGGLYRDPANTTWENIDTALLEPVYVSMVRDGNNCYAFISNNNGGRLTRYSFGNSFLNDPVPQNLRNPGGVIPNEAEGIQVVKDNNGWHVFVVGGTNESDSHIARIDLGNSLSNAPVAAVNLGNIGKMNYPHDLFITQEGDHWYGLTVNLQSHTLTRLDFGNSLSNTPTGINFGNPAFLSFPAGIFVTKEEGQWYMFVTNTIGKSLSRIDFGSSLGNTPTGTFLGSGGGSMHDPRDLVVMHDCGKTVGLMVDGTDGHLSRIDFAGGIAGGISLTPMNSGVAFRFSHSITNLFREGDDLYTFVPDVTTGQLSRLKFDICTNSSIASSTLQQPPDIFYNKAGIYTINLLMNESLPTQTAYCRTVVVVDPPLVDLGQDRVICKGAGVLLDAGRGFSRYKWSTGETSRTIVVRDEGSYRVEVSNGGCTGTDEVKVTFNPLLNGTVDVSDIICGVDHGRVQVNVSGGTPPYTYYLNGINKGSSHVSDQLPAGPYTVKVVDNIGCEITLLSEVKEDAAKVLKATAIAVSPSCNAGTDGLINVTIKAGAGPFSYALDNGAYQRNPTFGDLRAGSYVVQVRNADCNIAVPVVITDKDPLVVNVVKEDEYCGGANGTVATMVSGGTPPYNYYWNNAAGRERLSHLTAGTYQLIVSDQGNCVVQETVTLSNVFPPPVTITNNDTTINIGQSVQLHAVNAVDYSWTPVTGLSCPDCANPVAEPRQTTVYTVTTLTGKNCVKTDQVTIHLTFNNSLYIPTAFTPNGDGVNDQFVVRARGVAVYRIRIFNRWGQQVFTSNSVSGHWDGRLGGSLLPAGSYIYHITYSYFGREDQEMTQKGAFTLIR